MASKNKSTVTTELQQIKNEEIKYPANLLAKSDSIKSFGLHYDIIRAILCKPEYTIEEAKQAIINYINSFNV